MSRNVNWVWILRTDFEKPKVLVQLTYQSTSGWRDEVLKKLGSNHSILSHSNLIGVPMAFPLTFAGVSIKIEVARRFEYYPISQHSITRAHCYEDVGKLIERPGGGGNSNRFPIQIRIFSKESVGEGGPFHPTHWSWSETERRGSVQRHLLLPLGIQGPVHLHTLVHETCYFNVLASRFDFEYCE